MVKSGDSATATKMGRVEAVRLPSLKPFREIPGVTGTLEWKAESDVSTRSDTSNWSNVRFGS
jgi:hypothetical protein